MNGKCVQFDLLQNDSRQDGGKVEGGCRRETNVRVAR